MSAVIQLLALSLACVDCWAMLSHWYRHLQWDFLHAVTASQEIGFGASFPKACQARTCKILYLNKLISILITNLYVFRLHWGHICKGLFAKQYTNYLHIELLNSWYKTVTLFEELTHITRDCYPIYEYAHGNREVGVPCLKFPLYPESS